MNKWEPVKNQYGVIIAVRCPLCGYVFKLYFKNRCCMICGVYLEDWEESSDEADT